MTYDELNRAVPHMIFEQFKKIFDETDNDGQDSKEVYNDVIRNLCR